MDRRASAGGAVDARARRVAGFIAGFAGDDRYIVDYLVEELRGLEPLTFHAMVTWDAEGRGCEC
jgi:hypothetical protein